MVGSGLAVCVLCLVWWVLLVCFDTSIIVHHVCDKLSMNAMIVLPLLELLCECQTNKEASLSMLGEELLTELTLLSACGSSLCGLWVCP